MTIQLTAEQERRIQSVIDRGAYNTVEQVLEAALAAVEDRTISGFQGTREELETLIADGLASGEVTQAEFWAAAKKGRSELLEEYKRKRRS